MGGCCCSSRKTHLVGTPVYYYCPESFERLEPSGARASVGSTFTTGLLVDIGLETSIPDTFCAPAPLPYDLLLGRPLCPDSESIKGRIKETGLETLATCEDLEGSDCKTQASSVILSPRKSDVSKPKGYKELVDEEDESCPICFEDYDVENPRLTTTCEHDFHLSCLLEWIERNDRCPICDKGSKLFHVHTEDPEVQKKKKIKKSDIQEEEEDVKKDEAKFFFQRKFSETDKITLLKGILDFTSKSGDPYKDMDRFFAYVKKLIDFDANRSQLVTKIQRLNKKFRNNVKNSLKRGKSEDEITFSNDLDQQCFDLSKKIWGENGVLVYKLVQETPKSSWTSRNIADQDPWKT